VCCISATRRAHTNLARGSLQNREEAIRLANEAGFDGLYICRMYPGTLAEVEEAVKDTNPDVVVLDQIRGLDHPTQRHKP
jgi:sugar phosphate isomerase/epimerase